MVQVIPWQFLICWEHKVIQQPLLPRQRRVPVWQFKEPKHHFPQVERQKAQALCSGVSLAERLSAAHTVQRRQRGCRHWLGVSPAPGVSAERYRLGMTIRLPEFFSFLHTGVLKGLWC